MQVLEFEQIKGNMKILYKKDNEIFATTVISTTLGHPSTHMVRLKGGFSLYYNYNFAFDTNNEFTLDGINKAIYADNAKNRTELLLESETIFTDLNTE